VVWTVVKSQEPQVTLTFSQETDTFSTLPDLPYSTRPTLPDPSLCFCLQVCYPNLTLPDLTVLTPCARNFILPAITGTSRRYLEAPSEGRSLPCDSAPIPGLSGLDTWSWPQVAADSSDSSGQSWKESHLRARGMQREL
jgi:hypothetical protein